MGVERATEILTEGMKVTVDTKQRIIYQGQVQELLQMNWSNPWPSKTPRNFACCAGC